MQLRIAIPLARSVADTSRIFNPRMLPARGFSVTRLPEGVFPIILRFPYSDVEYPRIAQGDRSTGILLRAPTRWQNRVQEIVKRGGSSDGAGLGRTKHFLRETS